MPKTQPAKASLRWHSRGGGAVERGFHRFTRQQNDRKHTQHRSERHKQTSQHAITNEKITLAPGQKSAGNDNANRRTLLHKKKTAPGIPCGVSLTVMELRC